MTFLINNYQKTFQTLLHSHLLIVECNQHQIQFTIFNFTHQEILNTTSFLFTQLQNIHKTYKYDKSLQEIFYDVKSHPYELIDINNHHILFKVKLFKQQKPIVFELPLTQNKLAPNESIIYLKQFSKVKEEFYKTEILRLKSKIYTLMTEVEDATNLIKSQCLQTKNSKQQIKNLKNQLKMLQQEKKKQEEMFFIEVGVQHENSTQINDIVEWLECPQVKKFSLGEQKLKNLTKFIEQQIKENEKMLSIKTEVLPKNQIELHRTLSQRNICTQMQGIKNLQEKVYYSPDKVYLFEKSRQSLSLQNFSMKTLSSI